MENTYLRNIQQSYASDISYMNDYFLDVIDNTATLTTATLADQQAFKQARDLLFKAADLLRPYLPTV